MGLPVIGGSDGAWGTTLTNFLGGAAADGVPTIPNNRIPYLSGGNHSSSTNLTFDGTTLTVGTLALGANTHTLAGTLAGTYTLGGTPTIPLVVGGNAVDSTLALRSTRGVGSTDAILFQVGNNGGTEAGRITNIGMWLIGDTTNVNMTVGLTINQGVADNEVFALKSSDVAHGRTAIAETDTYFTIRKAGATTGGVRFDVLSENASAGSFEMRVHGVTPDTVASATATPGAFIIVIPHDNVNTATNLAANALVFGVAGQVGGTIRGLFFVDAEGDLFVDGSTTLTAFDEWDDVALVRAFDMSRTDRLIRSKWDDFVRYNVEDLKRAGILSDPLPGKGDPLVNVTQLQRLHNGALWQLGTRVMELEERNRQFESRLMQIEGRTN